MSLAVAGIAGLLLKAAVAVGATGAAVQLANDMSLKTGNSVVDILINAGLDKSRATQFAKTATAKNKAKAKSETTTETPSKSELIEPNIKELPTLERKTFNTGTLKGTQIEAKPSKSEAIDEAPSVSEAIDEAPSVSEAIDEAPSVSEAIDEAPSTGTPMGAIDEIEKTESETSNNGGSEGFNSMRAWEDWYLARREEEWAREDKLRKEQQARDDSAYQRAVEDMKAAGVNPNLIGTINTNYGTSFTQQASGGDYGSGNLLEEEKIDIDKVFNEAKIELQKMGLDRDMINNILGGLVKLIAAGM